MQQVTTIGIDTSKQALQVHAIDARGHVVLTKRSSRQ
jgi:hypothetical protein